MQGIRWRCLLLLMIFAALWASTPSAEARQNNGDTCLADQLDTSSVTARIQFDQNSKNFVKIYSYMTVAVPLDKWHEARQLTFSERSAEYKHAMRCLLRGRDTSQLTEEWRPHDPVVTATSRKVTVQYDSFAWIKNYGPIRIGPWHITRGQKRTWQVSLRPQTLQNARWQAVEADMSRMYFNDRSGLASSSDEDSLEWTNQKPARIDFEIELPWQRSWILSYGQSFWSKVGVAAWWVCASLVIALTALRTQRAGAASTAGTSNPSARPGNPGNPDGDGPPRAVLQWALLSGAFALMLLVSQRPVSPQWRALMCVAAGLALVLVARPWCDGMPVAIPDGTTDDPAVVGDRRRRQMHAVVGAASAVAATGLLVILAPQMFGLPHNLVSRAEPTLSGDVGYVLMGLAVVWLWLAAMAAWCWRFAREGGLVPASWGRRWDTAPVRCVAVVSALLTGVAGGLLGCFWWVNENQWKRVTWLTDRITGGQYGKYVNSSRANFSFTDLSWIFTYSWVLTGVALFALLHFRVRTQRAHADHRQERPALGPEGPDLLLTASVFVFTVGLQGATFAGTNAQYGAWLILNMGSLFAILAVGRRLSVLSQLGHAFCVKRLRNKKRRHELMAKAHEYRGVNHHLQLLDQGRAGDVTEQQLEGELRALRQWLVDGCGKKNPPDHLSVLDAALAWGPEGHWWTNGVRAARLAFCFGVPASGALLYLDTKDQWDWIQLSFEPTAIPGIVASFVAYQTAWAGAGFVLGALWRLLPGRRSPARAWSLTFSYAVPACLVVLLNKFTGVDFRDLLFYSVLMLIILTLTSIWTDASTFGEERQYWPSRLTLLVSIYQLRGLSAHIAWIGAQVAVAVGIWHELARR
ncbi:DUF6185 family protein [Streptomyces yokosukanensis]|uniref:DUF6185 family protein n=1 Tax=Streptomyces yokosukanensis TaxID=67386 RepID=UPI000834A1CC|nr:DUF6185 family protein [Streptomyces yokosukanensis]